jgi:predicted transcriptional regulator of viral defense system
VRRGLYAVVPVGSQPEFSPVDPYLLAAKMTNDAVLAYHTDLEFRGKSYSVYKKLCYVSAHKSLPLKFRDYQIKGVPLPKPLRAKGKEMFGVTSLKRSGVELRVATIERSLVDVLDRPELTGSWEEIWRSL